MFKDCSSLTSLNLTSFNTSLIESFDNMFSGCTSLTSLDIRNFSSVNSTICTDMMTSMPSTCTVYVDTTKFTKTEAECGFTGTFTNVA